LVEEIDVYSKVVLLERYGKTNYEKSSRACVTVESTVPLEGQGHQNDLKQELYAIEGDPVVQSRLFYL
jgi:hypothetical protein